jgi:hypothetical protein
MQTHAARKFLMFVNGSYWRQ